MPDAVDEALLAAVDLGRAALLEITPADTIGEPVGHIVEGDRVISLLFECTMTGYPGWHWTVSLARVDGDAEPSVLETELMPGDGALLAPEWVPWSDRLAESAADELADDDDEADDDDTDDTDESDESDDTDESDEPDDADGEAHGDDDFDDDRADDDLDGIDFGEILAASELNPGEPDEAEPETDDGAPDPPAEAGADEVGLEHEGAEKGD